VRVQQNESSRLIYFWFCYPRRCLSFVHIWISILPNMRTICWNQAVSPVFTFLLLHYNAYSLSMKSTTGIRSWRISSCETPAFYQGCNFVVKLLSVDERIPTSTDAKPPPMIVRSQGLQEHSVDRDHLHKLIQRRENCCTVGLWNLYNAFG
jgi:hypothetical protein